MKLYVDTNVFLDSILDRKNIFGKDISIPANKLFARSRNCEFYIILSDFTAIELTKQVKIEQTRIFFELLKKKIIQVKHTQQEFEEARKLAPNNPTDALHAIVAKNNGADYLVTRNLADFAPFSSLIKSKLPEDI